MRTLHRLPRHPALRGILLMVLALGAFAMMDTIAKYLSRWYPVPSIVWARYACNLAVLCVYLVLTRRFHVWRTQRPTLQIARGALLAGATTMYFTSLSVMPLTEAASIGFVLPLFVAALAVPLLKEYLDMPRLLAILAGLGGALIIVRPGSGVFTWYAILPVGMALCNALYQILTRMLSGVDGSFTSLFYGSLVGALLLSCAAPWFWAPPENLWHGGLLLVMGILATLGHLALIRAYESATATLLAPFVYSQLVWVMMLGWVVFGDFPDGWSLLGMGIIVASGLYTANRQRLTTRRS